MNHKAYMEAWMAQVVGIVLSFLLLWLLQEMYLFSSKLAIAEVIEAIIVDMKLQGLPCCTSDLAS